jgi:hypothetical protein
LKKSEKNSITENFKNIKFKHTGIKVLYGVLVAMVIFTLVRSAIRGEYNNVFFCVLTLVLFTLPTLVEHNLNIHLPNVFEGLVLVFIFSAEILGEINCYYEKIPHWDTILHTVNGFMFAAFGFALLDIINQNSKIKFKLSPIYLALTAFCFSMTIGVFWEFFEYYADLFFGTDMQKDTYVNYINTVILDPEHMNRVVNLPDISEVIIRYDGGKEVVLSGYLDVGISDTIKDLVVNFIGAAVFSVIGFFYVKRRGAGRIAKQFIPTLKDCGEEPEDEK